MTDIRGAGVRERYGGGGGRGMQRGMRGENGDGFSDNNISWWKREGGREGGSEERRALLPSPSLSFPLRKWLLALTPLLRVYVFTWRTHSAGEGERERERDREERERDREWEGEGERERR